MLDYIERLVRGGSWMSSERMCHLWVRDRFPQMVAESYRIGLRVMEVRE